MRCRHCHFDPDEARKLDQILRAIQDLGAKLMATLKDIQDDVAAESTVVDSAVTLLEGLSQQLKDAVAANDPAAIQAVIDGIDAQKQKLADAVAKNTPAAPAA